MIFKKPQEFHSESLSGISQFSTNMAVSMAHLGKQLFCMHSMLLLGCNSVISFFRISPN
ncbi:hypothetical protein XBKQ1_2790021 [Xenorhabdus bovienii str. kraussei Quebec]|uniref:Uncharacterized protein n=1 Tax=Xenorhabdus bovienii str. kraussei Quebec TaxID=1398203 RepID=A0A077PM40_XENBV|nr:hypothetical protein XBKQ1_2790021 [Xenorhabdus bovienii str. kraussei Quebec]